MREKLIARLSGYWKMEAANALLLPFACAAVVWYLGDRVGPGLSLAMVGCAGLLVIGSMGWRLELAGMQREDALAARLRRMLGPSRPLGLGFALLGAAGAAVELWLDGGFSASANAALVLGLLAVLEYVNYYVAQLQHFDHAADFKRLLRGRGFRRPHLAKVVAEWHANPANR